MSLARALPLDSAVDVLIAYTRLRQNEAEDRHAFQQAGLLAVGEIFRPGVLPELQNVLTPACISQPWVSVSRQNPLLNQLTWELCSSALLRVLEALSGWQHLLPDPYFSLGGWCHESRDAELHPLWQLPAALVLDIALRGELCLQHEGQSWSLAPGQALMRDARLPCSIQCAADGVALRVLCFHAPAAGEDAS